jgi:peptidoglycan/xylan/chitin deacetylase (PgdA/CDA1 family)
MDTILSQGKTSEAAFRAASDRLQSMTDQERRIALEEFRRYAGSAPQTSSVYLTLTREDVEKLDKSELIEIGAHTVTHPLLNALSREAQMDEILRGKVQLEEIVGHDVRSFAYPFGKYHSGTLSLVQEAGFSCACSTDAGVVTTAVDPFRLPRLQVVDCDAEKFSSWLSDQFES